MNFNVKKNFQEFSKYCSHFFYVKIHKIVPVKTFLTLYLINYLFLFLLLGEDQNLELNVERLLFRTSKISNIKRTKDELFDFIIFDFFKKIYICLNYSNTQNIWWFIPVKFGSYGVLIVLKNFKFAIFRNYKIWEIFRILEF